MKNITLLSLLIFFLFAPLTTEAQWFWKRKAKTESTPNPPEIKEQKEATKEAKPKATAPAEKESPAPVKAATEPIAEGTSTPPPKENPQPAKPATSSTPEPISPIVYADPTVTEKPNGSINWTEQYIEAKGYAAIDNERFTNPAQARLMAQRGAVVDAQRNLLEIVQGVKVVGETTVRDMITTSDLIQTRVEGVLKGAQLVGEPQMEMGAIVVVMRVPLYQSGGLAGAVYEEAVQQINKQFKNGEDNATTTFNKGNAAGSSTAHSQNKTSPFAFNFNGKTIDLSLFPVIVDERGNLVFDLSSLYDPNTGVFPRIMQTTRDVFEALEYKQGIQVIDVIDAFDGKIVVDSKKTKGINWSRIGRIAGQVGSVLLALL